MTKNGRPAGVHPMSLTDTRYGESTDASVCASTRRRSAWRGSPAMALWSSLTTTGLFRPMWTASNTSPMPPEPTRRPAL